MLFLCACNPLVWEKAREEIRLHLHSRDLHYKGIKIDFMIIFHQQNNRILGSKHFRVFWCCIYFRRLFLNGYISFANDISSSDLPWDNVLVLLKLWVFEVNSLRSEILSKVGHHWAISELKYDYSLCFFRPSQNTSCLTNLSPCFTHCASVTIYNCNTLYLPWISWITRLSFFAEEKVPCGFASVQSIKMHPLICHADPRAFRRANTRIEIAPPNMCKLMPRLQKRHQSLRIYIAIFFPVTKNFEISSCK